MTIEDRLKLTAAKDFVTTEEEPLFDAAELARMGKDIVVQHGFTANLAGIDWLRRHFPDLRIHRMNFRGILTRFISTAPLYRCGPVCF